MFSNTLRAQLSANELLNCNEGKCAANMEPVSWTHLANSLTGAGDDNRFASSGLLKLGVLEGIDKVINVVMVKFLDNSGHVCGTVSWSNWIMLFSAMRCMSR